MAGHEAADMLESGAWSGKARQEVGAMGNQPSEREGRRAFLKRAGAAAGATIWSIPTIQLFHMQAAAAQVATSVVATTAPTTSMTTPPFVEIPTLLSPTEGAVIEQNQSDIGCPPHATAGHGIQIHFDWTDSAAENGIAGYEIVATARDAIPIVSQFVGTSGLTWRSCNAFVIDKNLDDWIWRVRAVDRLGFRSSWTEWRTFSWAPCRLYGGEPCNAPAG